MEWLAIDTEPAKSGPGRDKALDVGCRLLAALDQGFRTHDFEDFIALTIDDFEYRLPLVGSMKGREALRQYYKIAATNGTELRFAEPVRTTASDTTVMFEFESQGQIAGVDGWRNMIAFSFDIDSAGERATGAREYWGVVDLNLIQSIMRKMEG